MAQVFEKAYWKGKIVPINEACVSVASAAVLYGLSIYTVFPITVTKNGLRAFRIHDHYERLIRSARIVGLDTFEPQWSFEKFQQSVRELVKVNTFDKDVFVRASVHVSDLVPGTRSRGLTTDLSMFIYEALPIVPQNGARIKTSLWRRTPDECIPSRAKVNGAYINSVLAKQDAIDCGYDDCVFLDSAGHVCELSAANIFMVRDGALITPGSSNSILEGINRRTILEITEKLGIKTVERNIDLTELYIADELFACGTSAFVAPIIEVDKRVVGNGVASGITKILREKHFNVLHGEESGFEYLLTEI